MINAQNILNAAVHQADLALREGRMGNTSNFEATLVRLNQTIQSSRTPNLTTQSLVRRLGRSKAMVLRIAKPQINLALEDA